MIQFNLLPSVKVEYLKAKRAKRVVILASAVSVAASLVLLIIMISITSVQKKHIADQTKDIKTRSTALQSTTDLSKILTIQNQLNSLPDLYKKRPVASRVFTYVQQTTPAQVSISDLSVDFEASTMVLKGTSDALESVNRYVDTLKFTTFVNAKDTTKKNAFTNVVLTTFSRDSKAASFNINLSYNSELFSSQETVTMNVPATVTTRSETELPSSGVFDSKVSK